MYYRWIIRSSFLALFLLVATAWPVSHFWRLDLGRVNGTNGISLSVFPSHLGIIWSSNRSTPIYRWYATTSAVKPEGHYLLDTQGWNFVGFGAGDFSIYPDPEMTLTQPPRSFNSIPFIYSHRILRIPFWFLTTASALLLFFAWRKTTRSNPARAFPIEPSFKA